MKPSERLDEVMRKAEINQFLWADLINEIVVILDEHSERLDKLEGKK